MITIPYTVSVYDKLISKSSTTGDTIISYHGRLVRSSYDDTYDNWLIVFDNDEDATAFKLKFGL